MNRFTIRGSEQLEAKIEADLERIVKLVSPHGEAGILLGGYGRGEGTPFINKDGSQSPFNDYDLVVVLDTVNSAVRVRFHELEQDVSKEIGLPVDLCPYARHELPSKEFSLLNCEMKHGHLVLWGDDHVLDAMPGYNIDSIPKTEGLRLLLNRGKLLLDMKRRLADPTPLPEEERIRFIKFIHKVLLAFGDSALLAAGKYDILYSVKKKRIGKIGDVPFRDAVISGYLQAIDLKEWGDYHALQDYDIKAEFNRISDIYIAFMAWCLDRYSKRESSIPKALALNLRWRKTTSIKHPREYLYRAIIDLLQDRSAMSHEDFYRLQRRFS